MGLCYKEYLLHDVVECLIAALEAKDIYTRGHSQRVAEMSVMLAEGIGLKGIELENVHIAAHLHDIGKIGISDYILSKKEKLLDKEWEQIKKHPHIGYLILNKSNHLKDISKIVLHHHERWDGCGYPYKLQGNDIPLGSRIIAICDSIDAMTSSRPYRNSLTIEEVLNEIYINKGSQFDPYLIDAVNINHFCEFAWENKFNVKD
ncbi:MAG: HD-GYP domain-containing protein [Firmicutes bacterium]|nr:HD-GYP domain-containing protein [Bacillota bacterium]